MTTTIITNTQYKAERLQYKTGSLCFPSDLWDCYSYCDIKALKKKLNIKNKVLHILVYMKDDPTFRNIANTDINYTYPVYVDRDMDGAYIGKRGWCCDHPIGDAIIVIDNSVEKKPKGEKKKTIKPKEEAKDNWRGENN